MAAYEIAALEALRHPKPSTQNLPLKTCHLKPST
jgi:hypothetical protein